MHPTARLPRAWWFPDLKGYRSTESGTYVCYPLDEQPKVSAADDEFRWLEDTPERAMASRTANRVSRPAR
jgi:hypothetical protein